MNGSASRRNELEKLSVWWFFAAKLGVDERPMTAELEYWYID